MAQNLLWSLIVDFDALLLECAVPAAIMTAAGRFVESNRAFAQLVGLSRGALEKCTIGEMLHPDDRCAARSAIGDIASGPDGSASLGLRFLLPHGLIDARVHLCRIALDGDRTGLLGLFQDLTAERRIRRHLAASHRKLSMLVESVPDQVMLLDRAGYVTFVNRAAQGIERDEILGTPAVELLDSKSELLFTMTLKRVLSEGCSQQVDLHGKDRRIYCCRFVPLDGRGGQVLLVCRDATHERPVSKPGAGLTGADIDSSPARFRALLDSIPKAVLEIGKGGEILFANEASSQLFGYSTQELETSNIDLLLPLRYASAHRQHRRLYYQETSRRQMGGAKKVHARRSDGTEIDVAVELAPTQHRYATDSVIALIGAVDSAQTFAERPLSQTRDSESAPSATLRPRRRTEH